VTTEATSETSNRSRRPLLALGGASLLVAAAGTAWLQGGAGADPVSTDVAATCTLGGSSVDVVVPMTVDDLVDPIAPGGAQTLHVDQGLGELPVEVTVSKVVVTTPIPAAVASTDSVTFEGGNMAGSYVIDGTNLVVTFTGPQSSSQLQFPRVVLGQTIADSPGTETIEWKVWSSMVTETNYGTATCTPNDPGANLNTTAVSAGGGAPTTTSTTAPDGSTTTTTPPDTTTTTTPPPDGEDEGDGEAPPTPQIEACVEVTSPVPAPVPVPCPVTIPPADGGGLPVPLPPTGGGIPEVPPAGGLPVPVPPAGGLPVPVPPEGGSPLPLPLPGGEGGGGLDVGIDVQIEVSL
jgi:hypothetical protein